MIYIYMIYIYTLFVKKGYYRSEPSSQRALNQTPNSLPGHETTNNSNVALELFPKSFHFCFLLGRKGPRRGECKHQWRCVVAASHADR